MTQLAKASTWSLTARDPTRQGCFSVPCLPGGGNYELVVTAPGRGSQRRSGQRDGHRPCNASAARFSVRSQVTGRPVQSEPVDLRLGSARVDSSY